VTKPVNELEPGDVVATDDGLVEMIEHPFLGRTGASVFDRCELFWRARARPLCARERLVCVTWPVATRVRVQGTH
jgi:hypothetical protein